MVLTLVYILDITFYRRVQINLQKFCISGHDMRYNSPPTNLIRLAKRGDSYSIVSSTHMSMFKSTFELPLRYTLIK